MRRIVRYLNPMAQLGSGHYSTLFPLLTMLGTGVIFEVVYNTIGNPAPVGLYLILVSITLILYFSFRDGLRGGFIAASLVIFYYFVVTYIHQDPAQRSNSIETIGVLGLLYFFIAGIIGWLKVNIDRLIEREANEKNRLQAIIQQLPVGVIITDNKGRVTERNRRTDTILGLKIPEGFRIGRDTIDSATIDSESIQPAQSPLATALSTGKAVVGKEYRYQHNGGKEVYLQVSSSPIRNRDGKTIAAATIFSDVTAQKEMEKRKDDFINMASHELKTPLTSMKLYLDSLIRHVSDKGDERTFKIIKSINYQAERLQELISDLLDVSRLNTGKMTFNKEVFRLDELIKESIEGIQQTTTKHEIIFQPKPAIKIFADKFRIDQVLTNLLTNAIKYSPTDSKIIVSLKRSNGKALVSVQDFGIGINKDQQKKIFERLYQVTEAAEKTYPGLGMGLYISKEIIRRHRGSLWVESEKGKGSTFFFTLPFIGKEV